MLLSDLVQAKLIRRYKRFLADVELADGSIITAHCPNPGSMTGMADSGMNVYLSYSSSPARKLPYTLKLVETATSLVVVDTMLANKLFKEAFDNGSLSEFSSFDLLAAEHTIGDSRLDFLLSGSGHDSRCYVEVKSTTMWQDGHALFPDARTERGRKHLASLSTIVQSGHNAAQFFLIGRNDARSFGPADHVDPLYGQALRSACEVGVQIYARALQFEFNPDFDREGLVRGLPFDLKVTVADSVPVKLGAI
jgi:sugar fermentation stimulation protein A